MHAATHQRLDVLFGHVATVPDHLLRESFPGFGYPSVWSQLIHILSVEQNWVHNLQDKPFANWGEEDPGTIAGLMVAKGRVRDATRAYLQSLSEAQLNNVLSNRPRAWVGELRSPAFILLHVITHTFHHKGQVVAMLRTLGYPAPDTDLQRE